LIRSAEKIDGGICVGVAGPSPGHCLTPFLI
jgi:hypothetical protein